jgi:hypothetical protein
MMSRGQDSQSNSGNTNEHTGNDSGDNYSSSPTDDLPF